MRKPPKRLFKNRARPDRPRAYNPDDDFYIAIHEAGHAVVAVVLGIDLKSVEIKRSHRPGANPSVGFTHVARVDVADKGEAAAMPHMISLMAGAWAEDRVNPRVWEGNAHKTDAGEARRIAEAAIRDLDTRSDGCLGVSAEEQAKIRLRVERLWRAAEDAAKQLVNEHAEAIRMVAKELVRRRELTGQQVRDIIAGK